MKSLNGEKRKDYSIEIDDRLIELLQEFKIATIGFLKKIYYKKYGINLSWVTIYKHLNNLLEKEKVMIEENLGSNKRKIRIYKVNINNIK